MLHLKLYFRTAAEATATAKELQKVM